jgi:hypothetical protein
MFTRTIGNGNQFKGFYEADDRGAAKRLPNPLQQQADTILSSPSSRDIFQAMQTKPAKVEEASNHPASDAKSGSLSSDQAVNASGSTAALKGLNANADQMHHIMEQNATPEAFKELAQLDPDGAKDFAVRNPEFHRQAMHDMGDEGFQQEVRLRVTGGVG